MRVPKFDSFGLFNELRVIYDVIEAQLLVLLQNKF